MQSISARTLTCLRNSMPKNSDNELNTPLFFDAVQIDSSALPQNDEF